MKMKITVIAATVVTLVINLLSNIIPFNNVTTAQVSDSFPIYFVPAGYVFAIWGVIYLGIIAYAIYQLKFIKLDEQKNFSEIGSWFLIASLANCLWLFLWQYEYIVATIFMMVLLLISLLGIYFEIKKIKNPTKKFLWMVKAPFSLYLGWITVATVANFSAVLFTLGYDGGNYAIWWAIGMMGVATLLAILMVIREKDYIYTLVIIWALIGIAVKFKTIMEMVQAVIIYVALMFIVSAISFVSKKNKQNKEKSINTNSN
jgi:translocator protein